MKFHSLLIFVMMLLIAIYGPVLPKITESTFLHATIIALIAGGVVHVIGKIDYLSKNKAPLWLTLLIYIGIPAAIIYFE